MDPTLPAQNIPPVEHPHSTNWLMLTLIAAISLALAGVAIYFAVQKQIPELQVTKIKPTPTPDITVNWERVKTDLYEIKYPGNLYKLSSATVLKSLNAISLISADSTNKENDSSNVFPITVKTTPKNNITFTTMDQLFGQAGVTTYDHNFFLKDKKPQELILDNAHGFVIYDIGAGVTGLEREIVVINKDNIYDIEIDNSYTKEPAKYKNLVNQILSTFRFIQ